MVRSCCTTSATRRSRRDLRAVFTAVTAASSQDWVLVPMTSMTRYTLTEPPRLVLVVALVPPGSGRYAHSQAQTCAGRGRRLDRRRPVTGCRQAVAASRRV